MPNKTSFPKPPRPPDSPRITDEACVRLSWMRLLDAALRRGAEAIAREEAEQELETQNATQSVTAGRVAFDCEAGNEEQRPSSL